MGMKIIRHSAGCFLIIILLCLLYIGTASATETPQTYVSLTFDDGRASQVNAGAILAAHGTNATFFVNSTRLGTSGYYMSLSDAYGLAAAGNEIGGHSKNHYDLTTLSDSVLLDEVCGDQQNLQNLGFPALSFAYPFGSTNAHVESMINACSANGYSVNDYQSARIVDGVQCPGCYMAETIPPADPYAVRTMPSPPNNLADLENAVLKAETTGGWVVIPLHSVCNAPGTAPIPGNAPDCSDQYSIAYDDLDQFLTWLTARSSQGTVIKTVNEMMQMPAPPPTVGPNLVLNPSLEYDYDINSEPDGYLLGGYGTNDYIYSRVSSGAHTGTFAEQLTVISLNSGDRKVVTAQDMGVATMFAVPGRSYETGVWYKSDVPVVFEAYYHDGSGWHYWTESPYAPASGDWSQLKWMTPPMPAGADYWSYGPTLTQVGTMTVDDFSAVMVRGNSVCEDGKPGLGLRTDSIFWDSYADYESNILSVKFAVSNPGVTTAYNVQINDVSSSMGVINTTTTPVMLGHISSGNESLFTLRYFIPPGVHNFRTSVDASAEDGCGDAYVYLGG
jgi:peptidoglycan/xylan/chitin deacetylase (PgdA/CDA1 family)